MYIMYILMYKLLYNKLYKIFYLFEIWTKIREMDV